jgi:hypothetical protein
VARQRQPCQREIVEREGGSIYTADMVKEISFWGITQESSSNKCGIAGGREQLDLERQHMNMWARRVGTKRSAEAVVLCEHGGEEE